VDLTEQRGVTKTSEVLPMVIHQKRNVRFASMLSSFIDVER
jgi:hypothetical protein